MSNDQISLNLLYQT